MADTNQIRDHATEFFADAEAIHLEDTLWWWVGRRTILRNYLDMVKHESSPCAILEVGCGSGSDLSLLAEYGKVTAVEQSEILSERARSRNVAQEVLVGNVFDLGILPGFDLTCLFDVLEHIEDDDGFLNKLTQCVKPGHLLLLSVPACQFLYSQHDALLHHYRRYSKRGLENLLQRNGYTILRGSYFLFFLFPLIALSRLKEKAMAMLGIKQAAVSLGVVPKWANWLLTLVLKLEAVISQRASFPIGVWLIVLARKN